MKRWQSILASIGISAGLAATQFIPPTIPFAQQIMQTVLAAAAAAVANKTSLSNPDGTRAQTPWVKP